MKKYLLFVIIGFFPQLLALPLIPNQLIVWNIGQGQWLTYSNPETCLHFDMGGERAPLLEIQKLCHKKKNILYLSHWDQDHISFISRFSRLVFSFCLAEKAHHSLSPSKQKIADSLKICSEPTTNLVQKIYSGSPFSQNSNSKSRVYYFKPAKMVIPGDSSISEELSWSNLVPIDTKLLLLGHHGSRTSSSEQLLRKLPNLVGAIASARKAKYRHPHPAVVARLKKRKTPMLQTEHWGHIKFEINEGF